MEATITLVTTTALALVQKFVPLLNDAAAIDAVISDLETYLPVVEQFATDLAQPFKNVIAALLNNSAVTDDQAASLKALDAKVDTAFDAAEAAYLAGNPST